MKNTLLSPALILVLFAVSGITLITVTDLLTEERRTLEKDSALRQQIQAVAPITLTDNYQQTSYVPETRSGNIQRIYPLMQNKKPAGYVLEVITHDGYNGTIRLLLGLDTQQQISGVRTIQHRETPGLGDQIDIEKSLWITGLNGLSADTEKKHWALRKQAGSFDNLTGATVTAKSVLNAVHNSLIYLSANPEQLHP